MNQRIKGKAKGIAEASQNQRSEGSLPSEKKGNTRRQRTHSTLTKERSNGKARGRDGTERIRGDSASISTLAT